MNGVHWNVLKTFNLKHSFFKELVINIFKKTELQFTINFYFSVHSSNLLTYLDSCSSRVNFSQGPKPSSTLTFNLSSREDLRNIPGIPLLYLHGNAPTLEKPSDLTESLTEKISDGKTNLSQHQHNILQELKKQKFGEEVKPIRKKRKGPRGPNPLSCKKSSKSKPSESLPTNQNSGKKKRRKKKKTVQE